MNWRGAVMRIRQALAVIGPPLVGIAIVAGLVYVILTYGYAAEWTGFGATTDSTGEAVPPKTLWDWMELLIIPASIGGGIALYNSWRQQLDRKLESERARDNALQAYLDDISQLIREEKLGAWPAEGEDPAAADRRAQIRLLAQAYTDTIFTVLKDDRLRRQTTARFLAQAVLTEDYGIQITGKDMSRASLAATKLHGADLIGANLQGAVLIEANLKEADLIAAKLQGADLSRANLQGADLTGANLRGAILTGANLQGAILVTATLESANAAKANLQMAYLRSADFRGADLTGANLLEADLRWTDLRRAILVKAHLRGADLGAARLEGARLGLEVFDTSSRLPDWTTWTTATDMAKFTDPKHSEFYEPPN